MKAFAAVLTFCGVGLMVVGLALVLLSLKNMADLNIWAGVGILSGILGLGLLFVARLFHSMGR